jgi:Flp pilus assembly pilin Flp
VNPVPRHSATSLLGRLFSDDRGQDLVEYALLAAFIGIAGWAVIMALPTVIGATYASWLDPNNGVPGQWNPPEPASAGS